MGEIVKFNDVSLNDGNGSDLFLSLLSVIGGSSELPMWLTDGFSVFFFGRWRGQCAYTLVTYSYRIR